MALIYKSDKLEIREDQFGNELFTILFCKTPDGEVAISCNNHNIKYYGAGLTGINYNSPLNLDMDRFFFFKNKENINEEHIINNIDKIKSLIPFG